MNETTRRAYHSIGARTLVHCTYYVYMDRGTNLVPTRVFGREGSSFCRPHILLVDVLSFKRAIAQAFFNIANSEGHGRRMREAGKRPVFISMRKQKQQGGRTDGRRRRKPDNTLNT